MWNLATESKSFLTRIFPALTSRWFKFLMLFQLGNAIAVWSHTVSGQWVLVAADKSAFVVSLVPAAVSLPFMLLAIPLGSIVTYRRRELVSALAMAAAAFVSLLSAAISYFELVNSYGLILITFVVGTSLATVGIAWQSLLPETVTRDKIPSAAVMDGAMFNAARALGPVLAGVGLMLIGPVWVFLINTTLFAGSAIGMLVSRKRWPSKVGVREPIWQSMRSGIWFARHSPWTQRLVYRMFAFGFPAAALWALLPVLAYERLGLDSAGFGIATGMLGLGAMIGTFIIGPLKERIPLNQFGGAGSAVYGTSLIVMSLTTSQLVAFLLMVPTGIAWIAMQSTWMTLGMQVLPDWVRPRIVALMMLTFQASQAIGSLVWGYLADLLGVAGSIAVAGVLLWITVNGFRVRGLTPATGLEPEQTTPQAEMEIIDIAGVIQVEQSYEVPPEKQTEFLAAMQKLRLSRLRLGATGWALLADPGQANLFIERFRLAQAADLVSINRDRITVPEARVRQQVEEIASKVHDPKILSVVDIKNPLPDNKPPEPN